MDTLKTIETSIVFMLRFELLVIYFANQLNMTIK